MALTRAGAVKEHGDRPAPPLEGSPDPLPGRTPVLALSRDWTEGTGQLEVSGSGWGMDSSPSRCPATLLGVYWDVPHPDWGLLPDPHD